LGKKRHKETHCSKITKRRPESLGAIGRGGRTRGKERRTPEKSAMRKCQRSKVSPPRFRTERKEAKG